MIFNSNGQLVTDKEINTDEYPIGEIINEAGLYYYLIIQEQEITHTGQFTKK
jgi:hypothetical protein